MKFDASVFCFFEAPAGVSDEGMGEGVLAHVSNLCAASLDVNLAVVDADKDADEKVQVQRNQRLNVATVAIGGAFDCM